MAEPLPPLMPLKIENSDDKAEEGTNINERLSNAVSGGNLKEVELCLDRGADVNMQAAGGMTPLHRAILFGNDGITQLLLNRKADIEAKDNDGETPLFRATLNGNKSLVKLLVDRKADINAKDSTGRSILHVAVDNEEILPLVLNQHPDVNVKSKNGETPLLRATIDDREDITRLLFDRGATIGAFDKEGDSELSQAAYNGNKALAELLIEKGADVGRSNELGMTALLWSAASGHMDVLQLLIGKGADIGASQKGGWTALHLSASNGHTDVVELLLKANTNGGGRGEQPVLGSVVGANNAKKRPMSISGNLDVNSKEKHVGQTSLHLASWYGHTAVIAVLLKYDANTSALDSDEWTALHSAAYNGNTETVKLLTSQMRALSIRAKNRNGDTALAIAADEGYTAIVQHLISCQVDLTPHDGASSDGFKWDTMERTDPKQVDAIGALLESEELSEDSPDIQQKNTQRMTLYWAARNGYKSLVDKLLPSIEEGESLGQVLYWAAVGGQEAVVKSILETRKQSDLNAILSKDNAKTVQAAAQNGHERVVEILLQKLMKVDENEALTRKWTPLHWAVSYDAEEAVDVVRYMLMNGANPEATNPEGMISAVDMARDLKAEHQNDSKIAKIVDLLETPLRYPRKPLQLVEPNNDAEGLEDVCKQFHSNIIDFYPFGGRFYTVERKSVVYDIIYQSGPDKIMSQARDIWEIDLEHRFRWIHLPANNWIWAEDLMKRISYESKKSAIEYTRLENFVEQNRREHLGKTHCRFMYPTLSFESKDFYSGEGANITKLRSKQKKGERDKTNKQKSVHSVQEAPAATDNVVDRNVSEVGTAKGLATDSIDSTGDFKHEINNVQVLTNEETKTHETKPEEIKAGDTKTEDTRAKRARPEESKDSGLKISKQQPEAHIENEKQKKNEKEKSREEGGIAHLEGSKIAICIPFLTFQTVASQRKLRQATKLAEEIRCPSEENQYIESATSLDKVGLARMVILRGEIDKGIALLKKTIRKQNLASKGMRKKLQTLLERIEIVKRNGNSESKENLDSLSKFLEHFKSEDVPSEILEWQERLQDGIEMVGQNEKTTENNNVKSAALKHEALLQHYLRLNEEWKGLHVSRTLDQYYYSALSDTSRRDIDQVVRRYQARKYMVKAQEKMSKTNENARDPDFQIGMVDQLWLWIIDDKTIITCFPQRWTQDTESSQRSELLDKIRSHIHEDMRPQISSVYHLATIITSMCVGFVEDCHARLPDGPESLLHMFASSIGIVADEEVKCFDAFKRELASRDSRDGKGSSISSSSQELDLHKEIQLLEEVKDIRDELNILNSICQEQKDLLQRLFGLIARPRPAAEQIEIAKDPVLNYYQERSDIHLRIERIRKMQMDATTTYDALNHLLDLKQKHANISEAIQARKQAEQATKQGRTILVFTIVTVIFLPMSFLTSLFALNVESFPRSAGSLSYPPKWIFPRIFGTSAALAFPLIFMAIYINNFLKESPHQDGQNGDFDDDMQESKVLSWTSQVSEDVSPASKQNYWRSFTKKAFGRETSSLKVESQLERGEKIVDKGASG